jgi:hypothetical protein
LNRYGGTGHGENDACYGLRVGDDSDTNRII